MYPSCALAVRAAIMLPARSGTCTRPSALEPAERTAANAAITQKRASVSHTEAVTFSTGTSIAPMPTAAAAMSRRRGHRSAMRAVLVEAIRNTTDPPARSTPTAASPTS